jgi:putative DNA primase/helicase
LKDFNETDVGNAERLEHEHGDSLRYSPEKGHWFYWDGTRWREDRKNYAHRLAQETIRYTIGVGGIVALWGKETEKRGGIARMLKEARVFPGIAVSMAEFDQSPWLLNVENGTLDLKSDLFYAHDRTDLITKLAGVSFDPAAMAPRWEQLISEIFGGDEDLIRYVQRALGYTLTGNTKEEVMWITYGRGANGKSTLLRTIRRLLGDYGTTANFATFEADNKSQTGNELATLQGSRFVMATESENERRLAEARVKAITGGDSISVRFLYSEWFEYTPQYKIWLAVNHKPVIRGTDHGIWRRIHLIPFLQTFEVGKERNLDETLESEFPGILNWLLAGLRDWRENGLNPPESVLAATREYREESDPLGEWLERLEKDIEKRETATDLYRDYKQWMIDRMEDKFALSMKSFSIQLAEKGFEKSRTKQGVRFHGLALPPVKPVSATKGD